MKNTPFTLRLSVSGEQIGAAAFHALVAAAWATYQAIVLSRYAAAPELPAVEERRRLAALAFESVIDGLDAGSPYRTELERYAKEVVPFKFSDLDERLKALLH